MTSFMVIFMFKMFPCCYYVICLSVLVKLVHREGKVMETLLSARAAHTWDKKKMDLENQQNLNSDIDTSCVWYSPLEDAPEETKGRDWDKYENGEGRLNKHNVGWCGSVWRERLADHLWGSWLGRLERENNQATSEAWTIHVSRG